MSIYPSVLNKLNVALFTGAAALFMAAPAVEAAIVYTNLTSAPLTIPNSIDGIYLNVVTGATGSSGSAVPGWDLNPYNNGAGLTFYGAASPSGILATGTAGLNAVTQSLAVGFVISSTPLTGFYNQFQTTAAAFQTPGQRYVGFRFLNESTSTINYGWALISTSAGTTGSLGFPASILGYAYENTGLSIMAGQISAVPEPSTFAMFGVAVAGALGLGAARRRRPSSSDPV